MNTSDSGVSDGAVGVDSVWKRKLGKLLAEAPLADSLLEALWPLADLLHGEGMEDLIGIIEDKSAEWCDLIYSPGGGFNLPRTYRLDFAIAIYLYTLAHPSLYSVINKVMFNPARRTPGAAGAAGVSDDLRACMPYIKFLDAALEALPPAYVFRGELRRGVRWVYPSPDNHDPKRHFAVGGTIMWYEFKSTSKKQEVLTRPHFCGVEPGPRTIFTVEACRGYDIEKFSFFQGVDSEFEVLFRPLSKFKVSHASKNIINPKDTSSLERSGFPDAVALQQVDDAQEQPQPAPTPAPASFGPLQYLKGKPLRCSSYYAVGGQTSDDCDLSSWTRNARYGSASLVPKLSQLTPEDSKSFAPWSCWESACSVTNQWLVFELDAPCMISQIGLTQSSNRPGYNAQSIATVHVGVSSTTPDAIENIYSTTLPDQRISWHATSQPSGFEPMLIDLPESTRKHQAIRYVRLFFADGWPERGHPNHGPWFVVSQVSFWGSPALL